MGLGETSGKLVYPHPYNRQNNFSNEMINSMKNKNSNWRLRVSEMPGIHKDDMM